MTTRIAVLCWAVAAGWPETPLAFGFFTTFFVIGGIAMAKGKKKNKKKGKKGKKDKKGKKK